MENDKFPQLRAHLRSMRAANPVIKANRHAKYAAARGTTVWYLRMVLSKGGKIDVALLKLLVENSKGRVTPAELHPDVDWTFFASPKARGRRSQPVASVAESSSAPA
jgi:hypothetical protein